MVSGFLTSPWLHERMDSGDATVMPTWSKPTARSSPTSSRKVGSMIINSEGYGVKEKQGWSGTCGKENGGGEKSRREDESAGRSSKEDCLRSGVSAVNGSAR